MTVVLGRHGAANIDLIYLGARLPADEDLAMLASAGRHGRHENEPDDAPIGGLLPQAGNGYAGRPFCKLVQPDSPRDCLFTLAAVHASSRHWSATWNDQVSGLQIGMKWELVSDRVLRISSTITAQGNRDLVVDHVATMSMPLPSCFSDMTSFPGRWTREMQAESQQIKRSPITLASSGGKPGFDAGNWLIFTGAESDPVLGCHASSRGDHLAHIARNQDGMVQLSMEAMRQPGGIRLKAGKSLDLNAVILVLGEDEQQMTERFHRYVRDKVLPGRAEWKPRKVHLNSWDALGFDLDQDRLMALADAAADLGVERFVLDDGWFAGRRSDRSGLGDWQVDRKIFPDGLAPLIGHVQSKGMDFGLWVEPEMISPDSELYRAHPDWCLHGEDAARPTERNQLVLDLARDEVFAHILSVLSQLLDSHDIAYLKWDHNRRLFPDNGQQQFAVKRLLSAIRERYPALEIESCSSGGGRISLAMLEHCHRLWPSDNNDPIERLRIMDSWTRFLPLEVLGNHVGPSPNPITGRRAEMDFRAKCAVFGHMGIEANPADMSAAERQILKAHVTLYKQWRELLHNGCFQRLSHADPGVFGQMVVAPGRALAIAAQTRFAEPFEAAPLRMPGLEPDRIYRVRLPEPWPDRASTYLDDRAAWREGIRISGRALAERGIALPLTHPETAWLIAIEAAKEERA